MRGLCWPAPRGLGPLPWKPPQRQPLHLCGATGSALRDWTRPVRPLYWEKHPRGNAAAPNTYVARAEQDPQDWTLLDCSRSRRLGGPRPFAGPESIKACDPDGERCSPPHRCREPPMPKPDTRVWDL